MRTMYDSTNPLDIPLHAQLVGGYISGRYTWSTAGWERFAHAVQVRIATQANVNDGNCLDVELGDATPGEAPGWVLRRRAAGVWPTVYCNQLNGWSAVRQAFRSQRVVEPPYWVARYDGVAMVPPGAVAKQYANPPLHKQGHFDLSFAVDVWPGIDQETIMPINQDDANLIRDTLLGAPISLHQFASGEVGSSVQASLEFQDWRAQMILSRLDALSAKVDRIATGNIDYAQLAKAVNDDTARRMQT